MTFNAKQGLRAVVAKQRRLLPKWRHISKNKIIYVKVECSMVYLWAIIFDF